MNVYPVLNITKFVSYVSEEKHQFTTFILYNNRVKFPN
jgi:hypothetical protein